MRQFPLFVICGPAAVGKTTIVKSLLRTIPELRSSVTFTTRQKRATLSEDKVMHYVTKSEFERLIKKDAFIEWAIVHGDYYGTHAAETEKLLANHPVVFNIDVQGMDQLKALYGKRVVTIFIAPESFEQMVSRLEARGVTPEDMKNRLNSAKKEFSREFDCDFRIVNVEGKLDETVEQVVDIIRHRTLTK